MLSAPPRTHSPVAISRLSPVLPLVVTVTHHCGRRPWSKHKVKVEARRCEAAKPREGLDFINKSGTLQTQWDADQARPSQIRTTWWNLRLISTHCHKSRTVAGSPPVHFLLLFAALVKLTRNPRCHGEQCHSENKTTFFLKLWNLTIGSCFLLSAHNASCCSCRSAVEYNNRKIAGP